jgi:hypothetical protein
MTRTQDPLETFPSLATVDPVVEAERLAGLLALQLEQLRQALMDRPWQAPALKQITRLLDSASRSAFSDAKIWGGLSHGTKLPRLVSGSVRPNGLRRAGDLLTLASKRLALLTKQ